MFCIAHKLMLKKNNKTALKIDLNEWIHEYLQYSPLLNLSVIKSNTTASTIAQPRNKNEHEENEYQNISHFRTLSFIVIVSSIYPDTLIWQIGKTDIQSFL